VFIRVVLNGDDGMFHAHHVIIDDDVVILVATDPDRRSVNREFIDDHPFVYEHDACHYAVPAVLGRQTPGIPISFFSF
jgi:hypothetical protein